MVYYTYRGECMIDERIKGLREKRGFTQSELARRLGITRASVNAWEMGISVPSTQYLVELANIFGVSTDFLLGLPSNSSVSLDGLPDDDAIIVHRIIEHLKTKNNKTP